MTEPVEQPLPGPPVHEPAEPDGELARRNVAFGWALFGLVVLIFAGTIGVALVYLALD